jgi:Peptidase C13 family
MGVRFRGRLSVLIPALAILVMVGHATAAVGHEPGWRVVLAAGDNAEQVFDDATHALTRRLVAAGVPAAHIHRLSASSAQVHGGVELATAANLLRSIADLQPGPRGRCFVFLTSHGEQEAGLWLARSDRALHPDELAAALSRGCGAAPTVVVVSGCYSGNFAVGRMASPNRIILTAARRDRPSFGCQPGRTYTFFDECLLGALPKSINWHQVFRGATRCVTREEHALSERPSYPQAYFGRQVTRLSVGF